MQNQAFREIPPNGSTAVFALKQFGEVVDQERALPGWEQRYSQLSPGRFSGSIASLQFSGLSILRERMNTVVAQTFSAPDNQIVYFGLPCVAAGYCARGVHFPGGTFGIGRAWSRFAVSHADSDVIMVMADLDALGEQFLPAHGAVKVGRSVAPDAMPEWLQSLLEVYASGEGARAAGMDTLIPDLIRDRLGLLLSHLSQTTGQEGVQGGGDRTVYRRTCEWLEANPREPATVTGLSRVLGTAPAELRRACLAVLGHPLDRVLLARRLGNARRDIIAARATPRRISDIALDWGFAHWGRFAGTYRDFFGETPSATLRAGRGRRPT